jgi:hypothetical protein
MAEERGERMRPTDCPKCEPYFTPIMQAEARHMLVTDGPKAVQAWVDEKLEKFHGNHRDTGDSE